MKTFKPLLLSLVAAAVVLAVVENASAVTRVIVHRMGSNPHVRYHRPRSTYYRPRSYYGSSYGYSSRYGGRYYGGSYPYRPRYHRDSHRRYYRPSYRVYRRGTSIRYSSPGYYVSYSSGGYCY